MQLHTGRPERGVNPDPSASYSSYRCYQVFFVKRSTADVCTCAGNVSRGPRSAVAKDQLH